MTELRTHDMYGHKIVPIGGGYGVSLTHFQHGGSQRLVPDFTFFHESDGFRQALFSVSGASVTGAERDRPQRHNTFHDRLAEVLALSCKICSDVLPGVIYVGEDKSWSFQRCPNGCVTPPGRSWGSYAVPSYTKEEFQLLIDQREEGAVSGG